PPRRAPVLLESGAGGPEPAAAGPTLALTAVTLDAPLPLPRRNLWCVGRNYRAHAKELSGTIFQRDDKPIDQWPMVFTKVPECVIGPNAAIKLPRGISQQIDYEAELAVII